MNDLTKYVMQQNSSTGRLVRSKVKWAGHMVRMDADTLVKRMEEKVEKTSRMQEKGNEQLRSKDCVRWDMRRSGEDERWRGGQPIKKYGKKRRKNDWIIFYLNLTHEHQ